MQTKETKERNPDFHTIHNNITEILKDAEWFPLAPHQMEKVQQKGGGRVVKSLTGGFSIFSTSLPLLLGEL